MIQLLQIPSLAETIFRDWKETMIWSCLQGVMGSIYMDEEEHPKSAMALLGDFCFLAGEPSRELAEFRPKGRNKDFLIIVPENEAWAALIEACYGQRAKRTIRYAIQKEKDVFNQEQLERAVQALSPEYTLELINEKLYQQCLIQNWSRDLVANYESYEQYRKLGIGVAALRNGIMVSGASSYSSYQGGIEIEIDTKKEFRRQGLAYVCGAKLILACLERGWYPSWDAQNLWSVALAEKLGYHFDSEYPVYEISGDEAV
ncbi:MAG: GNAT family N-acetyltransferase [Lachnospiraceae bacterium]|nr:GNAT family N-acetyltransferase [Lachnospiraceae bacterium]